MLKEPIVFVYCTKLLPRSQTFIREQVLAYQRWRGILLGRRSGVLPLGGVEVQLLGNPLRNNAALVARKLGIISEAAPSVLERVGPVELQRLKSQNASLLHAHFGPDAVMAWPLAKALGLPMVVTLHGSDINTYREWWESGRGGNGMRKYPSLLLELASQPRVHFLAVSNALRERAISFGISEDRISLQYIGIDIKKFTPGNTLVSQRAKRVLYVGRLVEKKGCAYLIRAMAEVQKKVPDASLVIVGEGPLERSLKKLALQLGVRVSFRGGVFSDEVKRELDMARVFCLPSVMAASGDAEGLPIVILEAQASGVPVVTSARGGVGEGIEDGKTGYAFAEADVATLADRLITLLTNDNLANGFAHEALRLVAERFDIRSCTRSLETFYDRLAFATPPGVES